MDVGLPKGSSKWWVTVPSNSADFEIISSSRGCAPIASLISRAKSASLYQRPPSWNFRVNARTGAGRALAINLAMVLESSPPLRKIPSGTSLDSRAVTASSMASCVSLITSCDASFSPAKATSQYRPVRSCPAFHSNQCAGGSSKIPWKIVCGAGTYK